MERATIPVNLGATYNPEAKVSEPERVPDSSPGPQIRAVETEIDSTVISFRRNGLDSWIVTVKPDAHTEIRLSIAKDGEDILIAAKLERGVVDGLTEHWPGLQRDLQQRGVILGRIEAADHNQATTDSEDSQHNRGPGHRFGRFHEPEDTDPVAEAQFIERLRRGRTSAMALTSLAVEPGRRAHFESWA
jgi:hypothetical protein